MGHVVEGSDQLRAVQEVEGADETDEAELHAVAFAIRELKGKLGNLEIVCDHESVVSEIRRGVTRPKSRSILSEIQQEIKANPSIQVELLAKNPVYKLLSQYEAEHNSRRIFSPPAGGLRGPRDSQLWFHQP